MNNITEALYRVRYIVSKEIGKFWIYVYLFIL